MTSGQLVAGSCPGCETQVRRSDVLIEYPTIDGAASYAECPGCGEVIHPA